MHTNALTTSLSYVPMGEQTLLIKFENILSPEVNKRVCSFAHIITERNIAGIERLIPAFNSLAVCYNPVIIKFTELVSELKLLENHIYSEASTNSKKIYIPVVFGGKYGPDLQEVSQKVKLSPDEVISILQSKPYLVYMLGFIAGFPHCGNIDERLILPRRANPRLKIPKGTIAIANEQLGLYTIESPGGWNLVGWTPMETFNPYCEPPSLLMAGDYIQCVQISAEEADLWDEQRQREWDQEWNSLK
ncbi:MULTISPECIES: 5-oxoprolinase subunit PxpB [Aneurinibacillus]|uniref:Allophanate hydrolase n=1 Tax=Aneurinibacillus danicus TaxID=267746 RepID=A0A511V0Z1_9BACL|nr:MULTISPECIES: 5-oxoprolinase subunit PxpB [Aneurinibacillus]GEN32574.1 allophanate hydrolase [Aneurinibacillus danicus]